VTTSTCGETSKRMSWWIVQRREHWRISRVSGAVGAL
jgi:hypothetical protein